MAGSRILAGFGIFWWVIAFCVTEGWIQLRGMGVEKLHSLQSDLENGSGQNWGLACHPNGVNSFVWGQRAGQHAIINSN